MTFGLGAEHGNFLGKESRDALHGLRCTRLERGLGHLFTLLHSLSEALQATLMFPGERTLHLRVTDEPDINARARCDPDAQRYVIEFTLGMLVWLDGAAAMIAVSADDTDATNKPNFLPHELDHDWRASYQAQLDQVSAALPDSHIGAWESLFQKFALAIFAHEAVHVTRGHIDLLSDTLGINGGIDELALRRVKPARAAQVIRLLEYDADAVAAEMIAHLSFDPPQLLYRWQTGTPKEKLIETLIGLTLFYIVLEERDQAAGQRLSDYPRPLLRLLITLVGMERVWSEKGIEDNYYQEVWGGALSVLKLFEENYPQIDLLRTLMEADTYRETLDEALAIIDALQEFELTIVNYAFGGDGLWPAAMNSNSSESSRRDA